MGFHLPAPNSVGGNDRKRSDRGHCDQRRRGWLVPLQNGVDKIQKHALQRFGLERSDHFQGALFVLVDQAIGLFKYPSFSIQLLDAMNTIGFAEFTFVARQRQQLSLFGFVQTGQRQPNT